MGFFTSQAELMQLRLLRWGYKCVLLSDVDELMIPDPDKYPGGLSEYIAKFENDTEKIYLRMTGYLISHVVDGDYVEPPLRWDQSILPQRKYFVRQPKYDKCLLSKTGIRYKPGFHTKYMPLAEIPQDLDILLMHLKELDSDFCYGREFQKYSLIRQAHVSELDKALNMHISGYEELKKNSELCRFAHAGYYTKYGPVDNKGTVSLTEIPERYRSVLM
jgi:hypothetical protein